MEPYQRQVNYYETDQMGIVHHSNYIRWFEEARIDFLNQLGLNYAALEQLGIFTAVLGYSCENKQPARFGDHFSIVVAPGTCNGVRLSFRYQVYRTGDHTLLATGETRHCFVNSELRPVSIKRKFSKIYATLSALIEPGATNSAHCP